MAELNLSRQEGISRLLQGKAPGNAELLRETTVGLDSLTAFLRRQYLETYIPAGGSKIKFVTGLQGSGKTCFAETIRQGQIRLNRANFNAASFMEELAAAYEITCLRNGARIGSTQALGKIYKNLALMARARKEYDMQAFAFDLSRLFEAGTEAWKTKDGVRYDFGTSRDGKTGIRVLSRTGVESFISTLRMMNDD